MKLCPDTTYLVESTEDDSVLLALDLKFDGALVEWFDTSRDRAFEAVTSEQTEDSLIGQTDASTYTFRSLNLDLYKIKVVDKVIGSPRFNSTAELQAYYRAFVR